MAFCGSNFSSDLVVKYVLMKLKIQHFPGEAFGARISNAIKFLPPPHSLDPGYATDPKRLPKQVNRIKDSRISLQPRSRAFSRGFGKYIFRVV